MDNLINFIKEKHPQNAIDISESLDLLVDTLDSLKKEINKEISQLAEKGEYDEIGNNTQYAKEINNLQRKYEDFIEKLEIEEKREEIAKENEKMLPNYEDYKVDFNIEHNLYEDFTYKRPFSFKLFEKKVNTKTWKEMLIKTSELLYEKNKNLFLKVIQKKAIQGKKRKYFSENKDELREKSRMKMRNCDIWIETNLSSNGIRNLIMKLLKEFDIKTNYFKVFFIADYTEINKK